MARFPAPNLLTSLNVHALAKYAVELLVVGIVYAALAKIDLTLAAAAS